MVTNGCITGSINADANDTAFMPQRDLDLPHQEHASMDINQEGKVSLLGCASGCQVMCDICRKGFKLGEEVF